MYKIPLSELKEKIIVSGKISASDLEKRIKEKINDLSGLISEEGAVHIISNELGIVLVQETHNNLKIKEMYAGMRSVSTVGKVIRKFDVREFSKGESTGRVGSLVLGDETGTIRVVFWNDKVSLLSQVKEDDVLIVKEGYVKENNNGRELHLGERSSMEVNPQGISISVAQKSASFKRKKIEELQPGDDNAEILGTVIQVYDPRFFEVHPETGRKIQPGEAIATPAYSYVLNVVVDDGTGNIRCVFWKNQTNKLLGKSGEEILKMKESPGLFEDLKTDLLGEQFKLMGRVQKNEMFDRLEFNIQIVEKASAAEELARLQKLR